MSVRDEIAPQCSCTVWGADFEHTTFDESCHFHGDDGTMVADFTPMLVRPAVDVEPPPPYEPDKWKYVIESLVGGLDYAGVVKWLAMHPDLDAAVEAARRLRD